MKPTIDVISLGGTITMQPKKMGVGVVPKLLASDLVNAIPEVEKFANIRTQTFSSVPSGKLTFTDIEILATKVANLENNDTSGVVIVQGTDTLEETAFILDLLLELKFPVVVTGAMRNPSIPSADGPSNLLSSIIVAASIDCELNSVLVVFNDEIHSARFVSKSHTSSTSAFKSTPLGPIGWVTEDTALFCLTPRKAPVPIVPATESKMVWVPIIKIGIDDDERLISAAVDAGANGLVLETFGGGHVPEKVANTAKQHAQKIPIILTSRTGHGLILTKTYGYPGSEIDLLSGGLITGGRLNSLKARVLLSMLLRHGCQDNDDIAEIFGVHGRT